jgi:hypothetical protein
MKKPACLILATAALVLVAVLPADAQRSGFGFRGSSGGQQGTAVRGGSFSGQQGTGFRGGSFSGQQGFAFRSGRRHNGGHNHFHSGTSFFVGVGAPLWWWGWGWPYYSYYPYYPYYPSYYYSDYGYYTYSPYDPYYPYRSVYPGQMVVQQAPPAYTQQGQPAEPYYWYYCEGAQAYYPYVQQCPAGWMKVVPTPANGPNPK